VRVTFSYPLTTNSLATSGNSTRLQTLLCSMDFNSSFITFNHFSGLSQFIACENQIGSLSLMFKSLSNSCRIPHSDLK